MILALLAAAAAQASAVDAERAFAARAQTHGQWTAFREYAAAEGIMFVPQQINAQQWLKGRKDPPQSVMWWPAEAWVSCDGGTALTTGPWRGNGGKVGGFFTTVWRKQPDGSWKWLLDHGDVLARPRTAGDEVVVRRASCRPLPRELRTVGVRGHELAASADRSLVWRWRVFEDRARIVWAELWDGRRYRTVLENKIDAPAR